MFGTPFVPDTTPNDLRGVAALLALIGNPKSDEAAALLAKLSAEKDAAVEAAQKAATDRAAAEQKYADTKKLNEQMRGQLADKLVDADKRLADHVAANEAVVARETKVSAAARQIEQAGAAHLDRVASDTNALAAREQRLSDREKDIDAREQKLVAGESDYAGRIAKLKALAG